MDLVQRELTKLATAAVIVDEMSKAAQVQDGMAKQAKMKPGLIALLAALGLTGAAGGAYAAGALGSASDITRGVRRVGGLLGIGGGGPDAAELERRRIKNSDTPKWFDAVPISQQGRRTWNIAARNARAYGDAVINAIFSDAHAPEPKPKETIRAARYAAGGAVRDAIAQATERLRDRVEMIERGREFSNTLTDNINRLLGR